MTRYAKRKLKYSLNENFNLLPYVEWDRFVTNFLILTIYMYMYHSVKSKKHCPDYGKIF
jgi:hypothetical protein